MRQEFGRLDVSKVHDILACGVSILQKDVSHALSFSYYTYGFQIGTV